MSIPDTRSHREIKGELFARVPRLKKAFDSVEFEFTKAQDRALPFRLRLQAFIQGRTNAGRKAGDFLDFATIFLPGYAADAREAAKVILNRAFNEQYTYNPQTDKIMPERIKPFLKQQSTWEGVAIVAGAIGIFISPEAATQIIAGAFMIFGGVKLWKKEAEEQK